jgi:transposase-like protein
MSPLKSDEYIRRAAQELHVDQALLRDLLNTADPDERLQGAARMVVDRGKESGAVARIFGVNEEYLGKAVWYMKENRQLEADELLQRAARRVVDGHEESGAVARIFGVNEEYLGKAVWYMKENRQREARRKQPPDRDWGKYPAS